MTDRDNEIKCASLGCLSRSVHLILALVASLLLLPPLCFADEVRPAYLELHETSANEFTVLLKTPMRGEARLALNVIISGHNQNISPVVTRATGDAAIQTWRIRTSEPLAGQSVGISGLDDTISDALVRVAFMNGNEWVQRLTPQRSSATVPEQQSVWSVAAVYLKLGVTHILTGFDHLLFVLALFI